MLVNMWYNDNGSGNFVLIVVIFTCPSIPGEFVHVSVLSS